MKTLLRNAGLAAAMLLCGIWYALTCRKALEAEAEEMALEEADLAAGGAK